MGIRHAQIRAKKKEGMPWLLAEKVWAVALKDSNSSLSWPQAYHLQASYAEFMRQVEERHVLREAPSKQIQAMHDMFS